LRSLTIRQPDSIISIKLRNAVETLPIRGDEDVSGQNAAHIFTNSAEDKGRRFASSTRIGDLNELHSGNDLIRARRARRISRRALITRALELGMATATVGVLLHATSDLAFGQNAGQPTPADGPTYPGSDPAPGGALALGVIGEFDTANPYLVGLKSLSAEPLSGVMNGLIAYDNQQLLHPSLAESFEVDDDGLTYTFHLRAGVIFHNSDDFTATDVIRSWEMIVNPAFPAASRLGWERITSIDAPDPLTVIVKTDRIFAPFLSTIAAAAFNCGSICSSRQLTSGPHAFAKLNKPIGTGPYQVTAWSQAEIVLDRFDRGWAGAPLLDRLTLRSYPDDDAQLAALKSGDIQIAHRVGAPGASRVQAALAVPNAAVLSFTGNSWAHLDLKQIGFLQEQAVRQALDFVTPTDEIIATILGGEAIRASADQQPGSWAFQPALTPRVFDVQAAEKLLDALELRPGADGIREKDGTPFVIELWGDQDDPHAEAVLTAIAASWGRIGVQASVNLNVASALFGPDGYQFTARMTAGYFRWSNYNDPDDRYYWNSAAIPSTPGAAGGNAPAFFHPYRFQAKIDDLTRRAALATDQARRKALYWEIQNLLFDEVPVIFMFWDQRFSAVSGNVGGYWPSSFTSLLWNCRDWWRV